MRVNLRKSLFLLPNLITLSSVFCGFSAILLCGNGASENDFYRAALLIVYAMFFDTIDGRVARLTKTQSALGVQLDSLADVISFGVAPACLLYRWSLASMGAVGLAACFAFVSAGVIRLARFNVLATNDSGAPKKPGKYILGLPIPGAAGIVVSLVVANHSVGGHLPQLRMLVLAVVLVLSACMVSTIRFRSFKDLTPSLRTVLFVVLCRGLHGLHRLPLQACLRAGVAVDQLRRDRPGRGVPQPLGPHLASGSPPGPSGRRPA